MSVLSNVKHTYVLIENDITSLTKPYIPASKQYDKLKEVLAKLRDLRFYLPLLKKGEAKSDFASTSLILNMMK